MKKKITVIVSIISIVFVMAFALAACNKETKPGYTALSAQADVFKELNAKTADVGIMDYTMANYLLSVDSAMAKNLTIADVEFEKEYYGIAFRKAADGKYNALTDLVNQVLVELKDTDYKTIAEKYGISAATLDLVYSKPAGEADNTELDYIKNKGKIVIGFTLNAPMALGEGDKTTGGFDTDLAKAVFAKISEKVGKTIAVEFKLIDWGKKESEMEAKTIDCVWNGMTLTDEVTSSMECTNPYLNNAQVVVVPADKADQYQDEASLADLSFAVETGSAGEAEVSALGLNYTPVAAQSDALMEVAAGTSDAAVIDSLMAGAMVGEGTGYENLTYTIGLNSEEYGVGFRKGSDLAQALNDFFKTSSEDGSLQACAEQYGVQAALIQQ